MFTLDVVEVDGQSAPEWSRITGKPRSFTAP
jgi:hypothetical protein